MLKQQIEQDLKAALLRGDKQHAETLRGLKSTILYAEVAQGTRTEGLADEHIVALLAKEAKKRQESADFYIKGGAQDRADKELAEKLIIEAYLPKQLTDDELRQIVDDTIAATGADSLQAMGQVIAQVKSKAGSAADGSRIAKAVKERLA
ncbi:MAG TPA: GatB/YqeY domain-containing protein [Nevskiaceae bacterium]|nr:GatB/YqeY domain-containing protein [Nevskiaceae bacterium]